MISAALGRRAAGRLRIACLVLLGATTAIIAGGPTTQPAKPCVAVLAAEVVGKMSRDEQRALTGQLDTWLTESLAGQKGFVAVDRQVLDKVLAERAATVGGLTKIERKDVPASLRPFFAGGVLVCPTIHKGEQGKMIVSVEAVLAQTGQLLAELHEQGVWKRGRWAKSPNVAGGLDGFWADIGRNLKRNLNRPVVEVADGRLKSKLTRLQWLVDELTDALRSRVGAENGVVLLTPRHPLSTKEERLLRVMGLSVAKPGDKAAGLAPTPDMRLSAELIEAVSSKVSFRKTPVAVKLTLRAGGKTVASESFAGTVGTFAKIRGEASKWFVGQLGKSTKTSVPAEAENLARKLAVEELSALHRLASFGYSDRDLELHRRVRLVRRGLRAAHLDPTSEEAAYMVAVHVSSLYSARGQDDTMACKDRILAEGRKYLDRFSGRVPAHHREVLGSVSSTAYSASWKVRGGSPSFTSILGKPDPRLYPYVRANVRAIAELGYLAETDKRYAGTNAFRVLGHRLRRDLIPTIPDEHLDEEYEYWRRFWKSKVEKVPGDKSDPWDLIESAFQARSKKPKPVRAAFRRLAKKYPASQTSIWRLGRERIIPLYLRAAGDPQWKTWKPSFDSKAITIPYKELHAYTRRCYPGFPAVWDYRNLPVLKATKLVLPKKVLDLGFRGKGWRVTYPRIGPLCRAGGDIWFITPTRWNTINLKVPHYLHVISEEEAFAAGSGDLTVQPQRLKWPKHPKADLSVKVSGRTGQLTISCVSVTGSGAGQTVWIGTKWHGIARFDKKGRRWTGRWYTRRDGMPSDMITGILAYRDRKGQRLLIGGPLDNKPYSKRPGLWTLDPDTHSVSIIDEEKLRVTAMGGHRIAVWRGPKRALPTPFGLVEAGNPDLENVEAFETLKLYCQVHLTRDHDGGTARRWIVLQDQLREVTRLSSTPPGVRSRQIALAPVRAGSRKRTGLLMIPDSSLPSSPLDRNRASNGGPVAATVGNALWMAINRSAGNPYRKRDGLLIFRPASSKGKPAAHQWIGAFQMADGERITDLWSDQAGHVWVTTGLNVYRVDAETFLASDAAVAHTRTKEQWRREYRKRLGASNWRCRVRAEALAGQWKNALRLLDTQRKLLATSAAPSDADKRGEHADLLMWRALVTANKPNGAKQAVRLYERIVADPLADRVAKYHAHRNILLLLCKTGEYEQALRRSGEFYRLYPPRRGSSSRYKGVLELHLDKARKAVVIRNRLKATGK